MRQLPEGSTQEHSCTHQQINLLSHEKGALLEFYFNGNSKKVASRSCLSFILR